MMMGLLQPSGARTPSNLAVHPHIHVPHPCPQPSRSRPIHPGPPRPNRSPVESVCLVNLSDISNQQRTDARCPSILEGLSPFPSFAGGECFDPATLMNERHLALPSLHQSACFFLLPCTSSHVRLAHRIAAFHPAPSASHQSRRSGPQPPDPPSLLRCRLGCDMTKNLTTSGGVVF